MSPLRKRFTVTATRNLERNLEHIERVLESIGASHRYDELIDDLADRVVPALERTPARGPPYRAESIAEESRQVLEHVRTLLGGEDLRQLVRGDFLVLYVVSGRKVHLLAVRHHREAAFRFMPRGV